MEDEDNEIRFSLVDPSVDKKTQVELAKYQLMYSSLGLVAGVLFVLAGLVLFFMGISGSIEWSAKLLGASSSMANAAPGVVLFIVGLFTIFITRYRFKHVKAK